MFNLTSFSQSLTELGAKPDAAMFETLQALYHEPTRHYHNHTHVSECLANFSSYRALAQHPAEIEAAIWYHDAIYDTRKGDNEEQSAELAERELDRAGTPVDSITRIANTIIATKTHQANSSDEALMVDVDLGILGTASHVFERYDDNIRKEYHWVPEDAYLKGRVEVLRSFLDRSVIYQTKTIRQQLEIRARTNLTAKIEQLGQ